MSTWYGYLFQAKISDESKVSISVCMIKAYIQLSTHNSVPNTHRAPPPSRAQCSTAPPHTHSQPTVTGRLSVQCPQGLTTVPRSYLNSVVRRIYLVFGMVQMGVQLVKQRCELFHQLLYGAVCKISSFSQCRQQDWMYMCLFAESTNFTTSSYIMFNVDIKAKDLKLPSSHTQSNCCHRQFLSSVHRNFQQCDSPLVTHLTWPKCR